MKKVTAFIGSAQKRATFLAIQEFEKCLKEHGDIDFEIVFLSDCRLEFCKGCTLCFNKGEEFCPLKDDRDILLAKLEQSDGVVFATPSYAFQVTARMKNFLDRTSFLFHRPRLFGKAFMAIVTQGMPVGGSKIRKYLESSAANMGFDVIKGSCVWTLAPMTEPRQNKLKQEIKKSAKRFYQGLVRPAPPVPSLFKLMLFRMTRSGIRHANVRLFDYSYYESQGWFESDYYHETKIGPVKNMIGHLCDQLGRRLFQ